jgi:hypothetical protein
MSQYAERSLESGGVPGFWVDNALVIGYKQIEAGITGTGAEGFY